MPERSRRQVKQDIKSSGVFLFKGGGSSMEKLEIGPITASGGKPQRHSCRGDKGKERVLTPMGGGVGKLI